MSLNELLPRLATATPAQLEQIGHVLNGQPAEQGNTDRRLLTFTDAAEVLNLSRPTIWRMVRDGELPCVEIRAGTRRISSQAITDFLNAKRRAK